MTVKPIAKQVYALDILVVSLIKTSTLCDNTSTLCINRLIYKNDISNIISNKKWITTKALNSFDIGIFIIINNQFLIYYKTSKVELLIYQMNTSLGLFYKIQQMNTSLDVFYKTHGWSHTPHAVTRGKLSDLEQLRRDRTLIEFNPSNLLLLLQNNPWLINYANPPSLITPGRTFQKQLLNFIHSEEVPSGSLLRVPSVEELVKKTLKHHGLGEWFMKMLYDTKSIIAGSFMLNIIIKRLLKIKTCCHKYSDKVPSYGDIDIFMTDVKKIIEIETIFKTYKVKYEAIRSDNTITIILKSNRNRGGIIQFILANANPVSLLYTFDIPISSIMFYKGKVIITKEAIFELMYGIHVNSQKKTVNYMSRLVKYSMGVKKNNGKGLKLIFPYYFPINTLLTNYSFNDFWCSIYINIQSAYYNDFKYGHSTLSNILAMNARSVISTNSFCLDGKSEICISFLNETKVNGNLFEYVDKLFAKLNHIKHLDIGKVDWSKTIQSIKEKNIIKGDLYNGNDIRIPLKKYPSDIANIIIGYMGDTIISI